MTTTTKLSVKEFVEKHSWECAVQLGLLKSTEINHCVYKRGKRTAFIPIKGLGKAILVNGTMDQIEKAFKSLECFTQFTDHGIDFAGALFAQRHRLTAEQIVYIEPGVHNVIKCSGTYFGSGTYVARAHSNVPMVSTGSRDTGFAVEELYEVNLAYSGDYLIVYMYSEPGPKKRKIYIVK